MEIKTYRAKRPLKMGLGYRQPGELCPEMNDYLRVDNFVHSGYLAEVWVTEDQFKEAVEQYCPELSDKLFSRVGIEQPGEEKTEAETEQQSDESQKVTAKKAAPQIRSNK